MCGRALLIKLGLDKADATPLNWPQLLTAIFALFGSAFNITFLFPFLPQMVLEFGYKEEDKGYYVGLIASSFFIGRAAGSNMWGYLSDKRGRKPFLMICLVLTAIATGVFGLSTSVAMAIGLRFLTGFVNGTVGLVKTVLYELSDDTNQGMAMSTISLAWGSGIVIGPLIGGYLSLPVEKYPSVFSGSEFFRQFPFMMPCLVSGVVCLAGCVVVFFKLPETNVKRIKKKKTATDELYDEPVKPAQNRQIKAIFVDVEGPDFIQSRSNLARILSAEDVSRQDQSGRSAIYKPSGLSRKMSMSEPNIRFSENQKRLLKQYSADEAHDEVDDEEETDEESGVKRKTFAGRCFNSIFCKLLRTKNVVLAIGLYSLTSFAIIGFEEVFILFASTKSYLGGLEFSTNELGTATGLMSIPLLTLQLFIFPRMERRFGAKNTALITSALLMVVIIVIPMTRLLIEQPVWLWITLFLMLGPLRILTTSAFTALSLLVNNSARPHHAGTVNGLAVLFAAIFRALAPLFGGSGFAWSITNDLPYPFDINFTFSVFSLVTLVAAIINVFTPASLDKQMKGARAGEPEPDNDT